MRFGITKVIGFNHILKENLKKVKLFHICPCMFAKCFQWELFWAIGQYLENHINYNVLKKVMNQSIHPSFMLKLKLKLLVKEVLTG